MLVSTNTTTVDKDGFEVGEFVDLRLNLRGQLSGWLQNDGLDALVDIVFLVSSD